MRRYFGTLEDFKSDSQSPAYATLARIHYKEAPESQGLMLVLKPRVAGIEPLDILNYKQASPDFPQQSTTDQFYDEAQWESYRSLGYWIAERIFSERTPASADKWVPRKLREFARTRNVALADVEPVALGLPLGDVCHKGSPRLRMLRA